MKQYKNISTLLPMVLIIACSALIGCDKKKLPTEFAVGDLPSTASDASALKDTSLEDKEKKDKVKTETDPDANKKTTAEEALNENQIIKDAFTKYADANLDANFNMDAVLNEADNTKLLTQYFTILENKDQNFWDKEKNEKAYLITQRFKDVFDLYAASPTFQTEMKKRVTAQPNVTDKQKEWAYPILYNLHLANNIYGSDMDQFYSYSSTKRDDQKAVHRIILGRVDFSPKGKKTLSDQDKRNLGVTVRIWDAWLDSNAQKPDGLSKKITGHADFDKPKNAKVNMKAGEKRADVVYTAVDSVLKDVFTPESMGDLLPLIDSDPASIFNRRAEIVIIQEDVITK